MARHDERSDARERALTLLYEAHSKGIDPAATIPLQVIEPDQMTCDLVTGVGRHVDRIDVLIRAKSQGWSIERMPVLDLTIMRLGVFELLERPSVPTAVVLDEAVGLAKRFSTDNSGRFVNGVLAAIATEVRPPTT
ncbi:MAG: transcription antitermination factor NusB [Ilumatobacteraceae bacterium]